MKKNLIISLAFLITICAAYYQRRTGPTYPKRINVTLNKSVYELKLVRSLDLNAISEVKLNINDTTVKARIFFKRFKSKKEYQFVNFIYRVNSKEEGFFAEVPQLPASGKLQYYIELTDSKGTRTYLKETPVVLRFKGNVPGIVLIPHILFMFAAMLFSTLAGLMSLTKVPLYKKYSRWTLILLIAGGFILGPVVQHYAFGDYWTGIPFGWDLTDNKTLIALVFWILAVIMNRKEDKPLYTALAAFVLLIIFTIPHSLFGSELNYTSGHVTQGFILNFF